MANSPVKKREGNWIESIFEKTSGTVTMGGKNWRMADRRVPSNDPRNNCATHFDRPQFPSRL